MAFDIFNTNLALEETAEMILVHPVTGVDLYDGTEDKPVTFTLVGTSNPKHKKALDVLMKSKAKRGRREPTAEESRQDSLTFLVALSVKVENMLYNGKVIDNPEVFKEMYSNDKFAWIVEQVTTFLGEKENFIQS